MSDFKAKRHQNSILAGAAPTSEGRGGVQTAEEQLSTVK